MKPEILITHIDTACVLLEINGYKILTDPTLDAAGKLYHHGFGAFSHKTEDPMLEPGILKDTDLILLSHHQHKDNFDEAGKAFTATVKNIISTPSASKAMPGITGLADWESIAIDTPKVKGLTITATPAQHRPWWVPEFLSGKVIGFIIEFDGQENGVIYISGDTVYFRGIEEVAKRYTIDIGIYHVGNVQFRYLTGWGKYTMDSNDLLKAVWTTQPHRAIPIHHSGWTHFKESLATLKKKIAAYAYAQDRIIYLQRGQRTLL